MKDTIIPFFCFLPPFHSTGATEYPDYPNRDSLSEAELSQFRGARLKFCRGASRHRDTKIRQSLFCPLPSCEPRNQSSRALLPSRNLIRSGCAEDSSQTNQHRSF